MWRKNFHAQYIERRVVQNRGATRASLPTITASSRRTVGSDALVAPVRFHFIKTQFLYTAYFLVSPATLSLVTSIKITSAARYSGKNQKPIWVANAPKIGGMNVLPT